MKLIDNWLNTLLKSWSVWLAVLGAALPDILQLVADNSSFLPFFDDGHKSMIRLGCLILIPVARIIKQPKPVAP